MPCLHSPCSSYICLQISVDYMGDVLKGDPTGIEQYCLYGTYIVTVTEGCQESVKITQHEEEADKLHIWQYLSP